MNQNPASEHGKALAALGASKGGKTRAAKLSKEERSEIARRAAAARWVTVERGNEGVIQATYGSSDHPLKIGDSEIPCYVVEDENRVLRVLVLGGMLKALKMAQGTAGRGSGTRLTRFTATKALRPYISDELAKLITSPILFKTPSGALAYGYEASVLADICDAVLEARRAGHLNRQQVHIAAQCEILVRGWARVGLVALIDEVTGYQYSRPRKALEEILERYISKEWLKWTKMFPDDFYREMFRLRNWQYVPASIKRCSYIGKLTNDVVYDRLAPGVLQELRRITPKDARGRRLYRFHQRLTEDVGHPKLREHLASTIALMRASVSWSEFHRLLQRAFPKLNTTLEFALPDQAVGSTQEIDP